jgi:hypothetical protein
VDVALKDDLKMSDVNFEWEWNSIIDFVRNRFDANFSYDRHVHNRQPSIGAG